MIRVLIAAPFPEVVGVHQRTAEYADELDVCGVAPRAASIVEQARMLQPDVLLLAEQPGSDPADMAARLAAIAPTTRIIVLARDELERPRGAVDAVLSLEAAAPELRTAILTAAGRIPEAPAPPAHARSDLREGSGTASDEEAGWLLELQADEDSGAGDSQAGVSAGDAAAATPAAAPGSWPPSWLQLHPDPEDDRSPGAEADPAGQVAVAEPRTEGTDAAPAADATDAGETGDAELGADARSAAVKDAGDEPPAEASPAEAPPDEAPAIEAPAPEAPTAAAAAIVESPAPPDASAPAEAAVAVVTAVEDEDAEPIREQPRKRVRRPGRTRAETVLVFSGKGGVGKSVVATNLAVALSMRGAKVALVDLDLQYGDVAVLLHVEAHPTSIESLAQQGDQVDAEFLEEVMAEGPEEVRALLAPSSPEFADLVTGASIRAILRELSRTYDYIVVDSPAHLEERVLEVMEVADQILVVSSFNITSVKDTKITLKLLQSLGIERERVAVVLNQVRPKINFPRADIEKSLRFEVLGQLPYDARVDDTIDTGQPMVVAEPRSEFARQLKLVVDYLSPEESQGARANTDDSRQRGGKRRFGLRR